jgi:transcriptional regulator with XRE-family HTH domain
MPELTRMDIKLKIGQRIKQLRNELGISQEALGLEAGVDRTYVSDVENGRRNVSVEILERLIKGLKVTMGEFFSSKDFKK